MEVLVEKFREHPLKVPESCFIGKIPGQHSTKFNKGRPLPEVQPLLCITFLPEKVPLSYNLYWKVVFH